MSKFIRPAVAVLLLVVLDACGSERDRLVPTTDGRSTVGDSGGDDSSAQAQGTQSGPNADGTSTAPTLTPSSPTSTPTPLPSPPDGWIEYESAALSLRLHYPPGWEVRPYDDRKFDLREISGDGWIDIHVVDESNDEDFSLRYLPGASAEALMEIIISAARQEGDFNDAERIITRTGIPAVLTEGTFELIAERELIAVMALPERVILAVGHAPIRGDVWDAALIQVYETVVWSIRPQ